MMMMGNMTRTVGDVRREIGEARVDGECRHASDPAGSWRGGKRFRFVDEGFDEPNRVKARSTIVGDEKRRIAGSVDDDRVDVGHVIETRGRGR